MKPLSVSAAELAKLRGSAGTAASLMKISLPTFGKLVNDGAFPRSNAAQGYLLGEVVSGTVRHYLKIANNKALGGANNNVAFAGARLREQNARAEARELANSISKGAYVSISDVEKHWSSLVSMFRERALSIAGKISAGLALALGRDLEEVHTAIDGEIFEMLETLSGGADVDSDDEDEALHAGRRRSREDNSGTDRSVIGIAGAL
jgi:hypothetical protein